MNLHQQLRLGGLLIILVSVLMSGTNILVYAGYHNAAIQAVFGVGFTGLILACTIVHVTQARKSGIFGLMAFLLSVLSLAYANVVTFLTLAELSGIEEARQSIVGLWDPFMRISVYGIFIGLTLFGISIVQAGVFPKWAGLLVAMGVALQLPTQYAVEATGPLFFLSTIGGSILFGAGLAWIGWSLWSGKGWERVKPGLSSLDRNWGGLLVIFTGLILAADAVANVFGQLSLTSGITHLLSYTVLLLTAFILYAAHGEHVGWSGFTGLLFVQLGAALYIITAFLIVAQLAGEIDNNRMLMASWQDIPVGRIGGYMAIFGVFLLGVEAVQSGVFPRWPGWLVVMGIAFALPFLFTIQEYFLGILWVLGATIEGFGFGWMGWSLLNKVSTRQVTQLNESSP